MDEDDTPKELKSPKLSEDDTLSFAESIINTVREPLIVLNKDLRVVSVSRFFYDVFKVKPEETLGQLIYDLGNKQWDIPKLRELLEAIIPHNESFDNYKVEHVFSTIGRRIMLLNARRIPRPPNEPNLFFWLSKILLSVKMRRKKRNICHFMIILQVYITGLFLRKN